MQFITALFGGADSTILNAAFALGIVLILIVLAMWVAKFAMRTSSNISRARGRRLSIVESLQIDARHKVTIIRRDNVEHVVLTGGAQDVVIESGIAVAEKPPMRRPVVAATPAEPAEPAAPAAPAPRPSMERLREAGRAAVQRKTLRNTGLLRPAHRGDAPVIPMSVYNSDAAAADSAKTAQVTETNGQAKLGVASTSRFSGEAQ